MKKAIMTCRPYMTTLLRLQNWQKWKHKSPVMEPKPTLPWKSKSQKRALYFLTYKCSQKLSNQNQRSFLLRKMWTGAE
ncbi:unnamed protein product [Prunus armeniaca]